MSRRTNRRRNEKKQNVASANGRGRKPTSSLEGFRSEVLPLHHRVLQHAQSWLQHCTRYWQLLRVKEHRLAQFLRKYLIQTVISNTILLLFFTLVGLNAPASYPPLFTFIHQFQAIAVFGITILVLYCIRVLCAGSGVNPIYHTRGKVNIVFPGHRPSQIRWVAHSPNSNGVVWYYTP